MKRTYIFFLPLFIISAATAGFQQFNSPLRRGKGASSFVVKRGDPISSIAQKLQRGGFIRSEAFFLALVRVSGQTRSIKYGEYILSDEMNGTKILRILANGAVATVRFTVPEGLHMRQVAELLEEIGILNADEFIEASTDGDTLRKYGIPFASAEGFLFPDTYIVARDLEASQIVEMMIRRFFEKLKEIPYADYTEEELRKVVIIASLVEEEAKLDSERDLVAAVFYNRLKKGKRLESCATVQYILGKPKERLLFSDLKVPSPYNTYLHAGLPPGPISNPGFNSLAAAVNPAKVDYLFFVSKKDDSHFFSSTYQEHLKAIQRYNMAGKIGYQLS